MGLNNSERDSLLQPIFINFIDDRRCDLIEEFYRKETVKKMDAMKSTGFPNKIF